MNGTSARQVLKHIPFGLPIAIAIYQIMELTGIQDEMVIRTAISILREHGELIFTTEDGKYYRPATPEELEEFRQRRPQDLRAMLAFRQRSKFGFNRGVETE